jgi:hypothetical protein
MKLPDNVKVLPVEENQKYLILTKSLTGFSMPAVSWWWLNHNHLQHLIGDIKGGYKEPGRYLIVEVKEVIEVKEVEHDTI